MSQEETIEEMKKCSKEELRLWIIQELSTVDSQCWWLIEAGIEELKKRYEKEREK